MKKDPIKVYTTNGEKPQLICYRAMVNGKRSLAIVKDDELFSYVTFEDFQRQMLMGPCLEFNIPEN